MNTNIKKVLLIIVTLVIVAGLFVLFKLKEAVVTRRLLTLDELSEEKAVRDKAKERLSAEEKELTGLKDSVEAARLKEKALQAELLRYDKELTSSKERISVLERESKSNKEKADIITSNITELKSRVVNIIKDTSKIKEELTLAEKTTDALKKRLAEYKKEREIGPVTTLPSITSPVDAPVAGSTADSKPDMRGEILTVNREFDFVVLSLGRASGVKEGMALNILRDGKILGQVTVETVRENISAAALVNKENILQIRAGDKVSL